MDRFMSNIFQHPEISGQYLNIRKESFFIDQQLHEQYLKSGWCKVEQVVMQEEIDSFLHTFDEISRLEGFELDKNLLNSGRLFNPEIRLKTQQVIRENAAKILPRIFEMGKLDLRTGGAYQVKPPHPNSDLLIHQDSTVIDEEADYCLFVWIPFCDVDFVNGHISFVEGSHLWGNTQRSLGVPWQFLNNVKTLYNLAKPVSVRKGDVLVFDPATIHASAPNLSDSIRHAITMTVLRKDYQLVYYFKNPELDPGLIEKYYVQESFYYDYDFISKPDETKWRKEILPYKDFHINKWQLISLYKQFAPDHP